jgi:hypothetical protein
LTVPAPVVTVVRLPVASYITVVAPSAVTWLALS